MRPWNPFSPSYEVAVDDEGQEFARKENEETETSCSSIYCTVADFLQENMFEDSIEIITNSTTKIEVTGDQFLTEIKNDMQYAKWFRPILGLGLALTLLLLLMLAEQYHLIVYLKALYESQSAPPERLDIVFSLTVMIGSKTVALAIEALLATIGLYLLISSCAWWYPTFSWISFLCFLQGTISIVAAVFWLLV